MYIKPVFKGHSDEGTPCDQGTLSQNGVLIPHVKEPVTKGHLLRRDTCSSSGSLFLHICTQITNMEGWLLKHYCCDPETRTVMCDVRTLSLT